MGGYAYTSLGGTVSAMWYQRRRRGLVALFAAVVVLVVAAHASLFAEKDQYHHAFTHVASAFPSLRRAALTFDTRLGLAEVDESKMTVHPIRELIERAKMLYEEQQAKIASIRTLEDAVEDYKRAFNMDPPRGFDTWYQWTVDNHALAVPSLIGQAVEPIKPFLAYPPDILRRRLYGDQHEAYAFCVVFQREGDEIKLNVTEPQVHKRKYWSPPAVKKLWEPIVHLVPRPFDEDPDTFLIFGWEDAPVRVISDEIMQQSKDLQARGELWDPAVLNAEEHKTLWSYGWTQMCPPGSPFRQIPKILMEHDMKAMYPYRDDVPHEQKTFIYDNQKSMDWCENPLLTQLSNTLVQDFWRRSGPMIPMFGQSRLYNSPELTWTPTMAFGQSAPENTWDDKVFGKLLWRGSPTGMLHSNTTAWRAQQRHRIAHLVNHPAGTRKVIIEDEGYLGSPVASVKEYPTDELVERYMNISFTGSKDKPPFCWHDGTCAELERELIYHPRVEPTEAVKFRYILDIDGYGWSSRFRRELTTGSVIVKATIYPEWYQDIIIPWYHYVPLQMDYSDLFDIMSFFEGAPDGSTPHNQHLAREIGDRGKAFVGERWREEDLQSFGLLQILEYQRMWSSDRQKATYRPQA